MTPSFADRNKKTQAIINLLKAEFEAAEISAWVEPAVLQPGELFDALYGEDMRRRMIATQDINGQRLILRPEFTVPLCKEFCDGIYFDGSIPSYPVTLGYQGEAWRLRDDRQNGVFQQTGVEWFNLEDEHEADAKAIKFAKSVQKRLGLEDVTLLINDVRLFRSLLDSLSIPLAIKQKITSAYTSGKDVRAYIQELIKPDANDKSAKSSMDIASAETLVEEIFSTMGMSQIGGRDAKDIAHRFAQKFDVAQLDDVGREQLRHLDALLALHIPASDLAEILNVLSSAVGGVFTHQVHHFQQKLASFTNQGLHLNDLIFHGDMPAKQAYYTGLIFALRDPFKLSPVLISGGRYDALFKKLGADNHIPAIGCALWLDDIAQVMEMPL